MGISMGKNAATLIVFVFLTALVAAAYGYVSASSPNTWTPRASMNVARAYLGVAAVDRKIYAIGGDEGSEIGNCMTGTSMTYLVVNATEEYDPTSDTWVSKAPMPTARALFGTAVYQGKIYCIGGYNGATVFYGPESYDWKTEYYDVGVNEVYDPVADTWQTQASLPTPRFSAATNIVNGKIYVIGGHTMTDLWSNFNLNEVYDPETDTWATKAPAPFNVSCPASAVVDGKIYVLGEDPNANWRHVILIYDPASDSWSIGAASPVSHAATAGATIGVKAPKRIYFFDENRTDVYDPSSGTWTAGATAPTDRLIAKAAVVDDLFYLIGGRTGQWGYMTFMDPCKLNEQYTPISYGNPDEPTPSPSPTPSPDPTPTPIEPPVSPSPSPDATPFSTEPEPVSANTVAVASGASVACVGIGLFLYFKKRGRSRNP
jgi:N-acetylneuraminic acid mutarotase